MKRPENSQADQTNQTNNDSYHNGQNQKPGGLQRLLRNNRFLLALSMVLAVWVWVILVMANGDTQQRVLTVPVEIDFTGTLAEEWELIPFWPGVPAMERPELTVDVTVESRKYEPVTEEDIRAELMVGSVNGAGDYDLEIRVSKRSGKEFEIIPTSKRTERVYFDTVKERTFELTPQLLGEVQVPEGYYADTVRLLPKTVRVYGAVTELNRISQIAAQIDVSEPLTETTEFPELPILCMNEFGDILGMYLTIEDGTAVSATIPVWKQANLQTGVEFRQAPVNYLNHPLPYKITPASVRAALPESSIPADRFSVGAVSFQELSPGANRFTFSVGEQTDIHYFGNVTQFAVEVDMSGMAEVSFTLPGTGISAVAGEDAPAAAAAFGNVARVRVVGPEAVVKELSPESLSGEVAITAETPAGSSVQPVTVRVARDDCWIFGAYETTVVLTEE